MFEMIFFIGSLVVVLASFIFINYQTKHTMAANGDITQVLLATVDKKINFWQRARWLVGTQLPPILLSMVVLTTGTLLGLLFLDYFPTHYYLALITSLLFMLIIGLLVKDILAWRAKIFENALYDIVLTMHAAASCGAPASLALAQAAENSRGFIKGALNNMLQRLELGADIKSSSKALADHFPSEGMRLFLNSIEFCWQSESNLEAVLAGLASVLRERLAFKRKIIGQLSGTVYAAVTAALFPYGLIPYLNWQQPDWLTPLTEHPYGPIFLVSALTCQVVGFIWIRAILRSTL
ncbi:MAG: tight adherence protein B [Psychromonas sp.]|jgi:tight adherence protein B